MALAHPLRRGTTLPVALWSLVTAPAVVIFVSSNVVNVGNLGFNMLFSRWMGPEVFGDLSLVLTIKLALLGVLGAIQMAVSRLTADTRGTEVQSQGQALAHINRLVFLATWFALPAVAAVLWQGSVATRIGLGSPYLLVILLASLPFSVPFSVLRGVAYGAQDAARIVVSANVEMAVRLVGGALAWQAGLGIEGVVAAIALSIAAGCLSLGGLLPRPGGAGTHIRPVAKAVALAALPFAVLQVAQVASLDGDIFLVNAILPPKEAGYIAALSLFQRIQFFACFALASVLLPSVVSAARSGRPILGAAAPVAGLFVAVTVPFLAAVELFPALLVDTMVGSEFREAAAGLRPAAIAAVAFTLSYLLSTFLAAIGDHRGIWATVTMAALQLGLSAHIAAMPGADFTDLIALKATCQTALCLFILVFTVVRTRACLSARPL